MHNTTDTPSIGTVSVNFDVDDARSNKTPLFNNSLLFNHTGFGILRLTDDSEVEIPGGLISAATSYVIQTVVEVGILPILVLCGVTMNVINMAVFYRQGLSDRINLCLFRFVQFSSG